MKKRLFALILAIAMMLSLCACGGSSSSGANRAAEKNMAMAETAAADGDAYYYTDEAPNEAAADETADSAQSGSTQQEQSSAYKNAKVKLIRRASIRLETKEFDAAVHGLEGLVNELDGYVEESSINQGDYGSSYRSATYTIRVPSEKYADFLSRVSAEEHCHLSSKDESTEDVGQQYFDTETRLKTLRTKLDRLQDLLSKAEQMEDIITLEEAITETEYQIERHSSTLNRYDSLIGYATFTVTISQVVSITDTDTIPFAQRLGNAFLGGLESFIEGVQGFLVWLVGNIFGIALFVVIILLIRLFLRKRREKREKKLLEMGIDPKAPRSGWHPIKNRHRVPPAPMTPPPFGRQAGDTASQAPFSNGMPTADVAPVDQNPKPQQTASETEEHASLEK